MHASLFVYNYNSISGAFGFNHTPAPEGQNIVTTTRSHSNKTVVDAVEASEPTEVTRVGGAGHKVCRKGHVVAGS